MTPETETPPQSEPDYDASWQSTHSSPVNWIDDERRRNQRMASYLITLANQMGLRDWEIRFSSEAPRAEAHGDEKIAATVAVIYGRKHAVIRFASYWWKEAEIDTRYFAVHELVHCHLESLRWATNNMNMQLSPPAWTIFQASISDEIEKAVDAIASGWSPNLPLISDIEDIDVLEIRDASLWFETSAT